MATLQLVALGALGLDDALVRHVPSNPYGFGVTIRQLLCHTSGIPNPLPLRWVHPAAAHDGFDEAAALAEVLRAHPRLAAPPGRSYRYSNIGYWLLGRVIEQVAGAPFTTHVTNNVFERLGAGPDALAYRIADPERQAGGHLEEFSFLNAARRLLIDGALIGERVGRWVVIRSHYTNGPAFGGIVGTSRGFGAFLSDLLRPESVLLDSAARALLFQPQSTANGRPIPMTLGWHTRALDGVPFCFKEGGGGGFHSMMRLYPTRGLGTVMMANATGFRVGRRMDQADRLLLAR